MSLLVIMGSGETAPTMIKVHRAVLAEATDQAAADRPADTSPTGPAVVLDTPFGFQVNADDLVEKTLGYFRQSVGMDVEVATWRTAAAPALEREQTLSLLHQARWVFAGPGSPSYALRQWEGTGIAEALLDVSSRGGTIVFGSAAACTLGALSIPVYEIYKVGADPHWTPGLGLLARLTGLDAVVVPHYDNAEGGQYDTRFCYLGEARLRAMEEELPEEVGILGVDEHTAVLLDTSARTARVVGNGVLTLRRRGVSRVLPSGSTVGLDELGALLRGVAPTASTDGSAPGPAASATGSGAAPTTSTAPDADLPSLRREADRLRLAFESALSAADVDGCVAAVLALEQAVVDWSTDTDENDDTDHARRVLRGLVVRLGELARVGARDPRAVVSPFVELLLQLRGRARESRDYATSDLVRDGLAAAGVEVRDTPGGVTWLLAAPAEPLTRVG